MKLKHDMKTVPYCLIAMLILFARPCAAEEPTWATFAAHEGTAVFLTLGTALPLVTDGSDGADHALRTADALAATVLVSEGIKRLVREERPDGSDRKSFPSMHTASAFAVATMQSHYHHDQAVFWYLGAAVIGASRVELNRHYVHDVLAGAAVGYVMARITLDQPRGLLLTPCINEPALALSQQERPDGVIVTPLFLPDGYGIQATTSF